MNEMSPVIAKEPMPLAEDSDAAMIEARLLSLVLDGEGPSWLQIRRAIARKIISGAWRAGSRIPPEISMANRFGTSRMTVAKAIQMLAKEGIVERHRKIGTVVAIRAQERPVFEIWDVSDIVHQMGRTYSYKLLSCNFVADDGDARQKLGVGKTTQMLKMKSVHLADGVPFQYEERLINVEAAPGITCQPLESVCPSAWLLANIPWTEAEHVVTAVEAEKPVADALDLKIGAACMLVERHTWNGDVPVTFVSLWHHGAAHRLVGRFAPSH
jgi:GntR family histidine utilization transcriptional repressor